MVADCCCDNYPDAYQCAPNHPEKKPISATIQLTDSSCWKEVAVALELLAKIFGGGFLSARPLLRQPRPGGPGHR